jgi:methyltransferase family protein
MTYKIKAGYVTRAEPAYTVDTDDGGFQPHVYELAATLGRLAGSHRVIDVGCGKAVKLVKNFHPRCDIVGVDYGENLEVAAALYPFGTWVRADLESDPWQWMQHLGEYWRGSVVICSDVIEHLKDPRPMLSGLRVLMDFADVGVLSTPERVLCYGKAHNGPPPNPSHVREWTRVELLELLDEAGLRVQFSGFTQTHIDHPETGEHQGCQTTVVVLKGQKS